MADYYLSIYKPVSGWKAVLYGPEGPEKTSFFAYDTPHEALHVASDWACRMGLRLDVLLKDITRCLKCGGWMVKGDCPRCSSIALRNSIKRLHHTPRVVA